MAFSLQFTPISAVAWGPGLAISPAVKQLRFPETAGNLDRQLTVSFACGYRQLPVERAAVLPDRHQPQLYVACYVTGGCDGRFV
jgi:hypothetical protein